MRTPSERAQLISKITIGILFSLWACLFIFHSSHIGVDGNRYFALFDDAYISMRYAWNLSHGHGLVWNIGEQIEGYTNLLMTLYMSLVTTVFNKRLSALVIQISGAVFMLGTAQVVSMIMGLLSQNSPQKTRASLSIAAYAFSLAYYPLLFWSLMGMETGLLTLLISIAYYFMLSFMKQGSNTDLWLGSAFFSLASITRPDAILFAVPVFLYLFLVNVKARNGAGIQQLFFAGLIVILLPSAQLLFRWQYYGVLVPNTYTLKVAGIPIDIRLRSGLTFIKPFLKSMVWMIGLMVVGISSRERRFERVLFFSFLILLAYQIWVGGEPWFYWRLLSPAIPLCTVLCLMGAERILSWPLARLRERPSVTTGGFILGGVLILIALAADRFGGYPGFGFLEMSIIQFGLILIMLSGYVTYSRTRVNTSRLASSLAIVFTGLTFFIANHTFLPEYVFQRPAYTTTEHASTVDYAIIISEVVHEDASIGVAWAGAIPYYTGLYSVDFLGKTDPYIANLPPEIGDDALHWGGMLTVPGHNKYDLQYSIGVRQPTILHVVRWGSQDLSDWVEDHYERVSYRDFVVYALRDSEQIDWAKLLGGS